jgi:hypothetical protein
MGVESELNHRTFQDAIDRDDLSSVVRQIIEHQFLLIHLADETESDEVLGALTAEHDGNDYLVAFSNQANASIFVEKRSDLFGDESEVAGFWVDGQLMLDYLDDELGILINPDGVGQKRIGIDWVGRILDELNLH